MSVPKVLIRPVTYYAMIIAGWLLTAASGLLATLCLPRYNNTFDPTFLAASITAMVGAMMIFGLASIIDLLFNIAKRQEEQAFAFLADEKEYG